MVHKSRCIHIHAPPCHQLRVTLPLAITGNREHHMCAARRGMQRTSTDRPATDPSSLATDLRDTPASCSGVIGFLYRCNPPDVPRYCIPILTSLHIHTFCDMYSVVSGA